MLVFSASLDTKLNNLLFYLELLQLFLVSHLGGVADVRVVVDDVGLELRVITWEFDWLELTLRLLLLGLSIILFLFP
jgi:hypothetical protein